MMLKMMIVNDNKRVSRTILIISTDLKSIRGIKDYGRKNPVVLGCAFLVRWYNVNLTEPHPFPAGGVWLRGVV